MYTAQQIALVQDREAKATQAVRDEGPPAGATSALFPRTDSVPSTGAALHASSGL